MAQRLECIGTEISYNNISLTFILCLCLCVYVCVFLITQVSVPGNNQPFAYIEYAYRLHTFIHTYI